MKIIESDEIQRRVDEFKQLVEINTGEPAIYQWCDSGIFASMDILHYAEEEWIDEHSIQELAFLLMGEVLRKRFGFEVVDYGREQGFRISHPIKNYRFSLFDIKELQKKLSADEGDEIPFSIALEWYFRKSCRLGVFS